MDDISLNTSIFRNLNEQDLDIVQKVGQKVCVKKGEIIFAEGDMGDSMYLIESGMIKLTHLISLGVEKTLLVLNAGNLFGEMALISTGNRSATAIAEEDSVLIVFQQKVFFSLLEKSSSIGLTLLRNMLQLLAERLRITTNGYLQSVAWGVDVANAASLNLDKMIRDQLEIEVNCTNGSRNIGRLVKVERNSVGLDLFIKDCNGKIMMIPYHAIVTIDIGSSNIGLL